MNHSMALFTAFFINICIPVTLNLFSNKMLVVETTYVSVLLLG